MLQSALEVSLLALLLFPGSSAFSPPARYRCRTMFRQSRSNNILMTSSESIQSSVLSLELEKPLGIILEEVEEGVPKGVTVKALAESGSAFLYRDAIEGCKILRVMEQDVTSLAFEDVMEAIIEAPSPLTIEFEVQGEVPAEEERLFDVGSIVTINVIQEGKPDLAIEAKVGDNLRQTLLDNNVEVYRGMKKKLGNCGGAGQCTFCAVDFVDSEGWQQRSDYEDKKIGKWPNARLACLNNIQGPATVRVQ